MKFNNFEIRLLVDLKIIFEIFVVCCNNIPGDQIRKTKFI